MDPILEEMQRYYRERAPEYDEWWLRKGRYDRGEAENRIWFAEVAELQAIIDAADFSGDILELAGGTGNWTVRLARRATTLTVLDGAPEMIAINRGRLAEAGLLERVTFEQVDLFDWQPSRQYDAVFFGFWLSHVPAERLDGFLDTVAAALRPGGTLGVVDSRREPRSVSLDQPLAPAGVDVMTRRLNDGTAWQVVKRFDDPDDLTARLARHGFDAWVGTTATHFLYVVARRR